MANFSTNQVKQLYVGNNHVAVNMAVSTVGDLSIQYNSKEMWLQNFGYGGAVRSDLINKANVTSITAKKATVQNYQRYLVALNSDGLSGGAPIVGIDYILRIAFRQFVGISEEDQYFKYGTVHVTTGMTASAFYIALAQSLFKNFSRDISKLVNIYMYDGTNYMQVTAATVNSITGASYTGVAIEEAPQDWILGVYKQYSVNYTVQPVSILNNSQEVIWGTVTDTTSTNTNYYINGKVMADMEYFCMGERGDIYRNVGFPYILHTQYLIDSTKEYHSIDIAYFYQGNAEDIQKSPKTITILVPKGATGAEYTTANAFLADIRTATGLTTTQLPVLA